MLLGAVVHRLVIARAIALLSVLALTVGPAPVGVGRPP